MDMPTLTLQIPTSLYDRLQSLASKENTSLIKVIERLVAEGLSPTAETIITDPGLRGGRPIIAGTGTTVRTVVGLYKLGLSPEEIDGELPGLTLAQVYAALAYYHAHIDKVEADILADSESALMER